MKNKKSIAMAMAAVSTFGAVAPAFANETTTVKPMTATEPVVDVALSEGNKVKTMTYGEVYDTHFTADKKDDTLKKGLTILDVISNEEGKESYLVATKKTIADYKEENADAVKDKTDKQVEAMLANEIAVAKNDLEKTINEIKFLLTKNFVTDNGEKKVLYTIDKKNSGEVQAEDNTIDQEKERNFYQLVLELSLIHI